MERNLLIPTYPKTKLRMTESVGVSVLTNIQLLDYCLNNSAVESKWVKDFAKALPENLKKDLRVLRTIFAHGVILRDYYLKHQTSINQDWDDFREWWETFSETDVLELVIYGIQENMAYYEKYLPSDPSVDEKLQEISLESEQLKVLSNREKAISIVLESWSVKDFEELASLFNDLKGVKERIIRLLDGVWNSGFQACWQSSKSRIVGWKENQLSKLSNPYGMNEEAIFDITGLYPDTMEKEEMNRVHELTFIPVPNMGRLLSFLKFNRHGFLMFEPTSTNDYASAEKNNSAEVNLAFEGLGDSTRLQIIPLLSKKDGMLNQQIVNELNLKQSSVSRHLNYLHKTNLVSVRQEGNTKYYSINQNEIKKVIYVLENLLK